jgi:hypothetical protein
MPYLIRHPRCRTSYRAPSRIECSVPESNRAHGSRERIHAVLLSTKIRRGIDATRENRL